MSIAVVNSVEQVHPLRSLRFYEIDSGGGEDDRPLRSA